MDGRFYLYFFQKMIRYVEKSKASYLYIIFRSLQMHIWRINRVFSRICIVQICGTRFCIICSKIISREMCLSCVNWKNLPSIKAFACKFMSYAVYGGNCNIAEHIIRRILCARKIYAERIAVIYLFPMPHSKIHFKYIEKPLG